MEIKLGLIIVVAIALAIMTGVVSFPTPTLQEPAQVVSGGAATPEVVQQTKTDEWGNTYCWDSNSRQWVQACYNK